MSPGTLPPLITKIVDFKLILFYFLNTVASRPTASQLVRGLSDRLSVG